MTISRRHFLIGSSATVAGAILPNFASRALDYLNKTGQPLLEHRGSGQTLIHAIDREIDYLLIDAHAGPDSILPPPTTWREFFEFDGIEITEQYLEENWFISMDVLDEEADEFAVETQWEYARSPSAQAFTKLSKFRDQIGFVSDGDDDTLGSVEFNEFSHPGSDQRWVSVSSPQALSFLQYRLNQLGSNVRIELAPQEALVG